MCNCPITSPVLVSLLSIVHIPVMNGSLWNMEQVHSEILLNFRIIFAPKSTAENSRIYITKLNNSFMVLV